MDFFCNHWFSCSTKYLKINLLAKSLSRPSFFFLTSYTQLSGGFLVVVRVHVHKVVVGGEEVLTTVLPPLDSTSDVLSRQTKLH